MIADCPNGFIRNDLLVYGQGLDPFVPKWVSKGFIVDCPDRANASDEFNTDFHGQVRRVLQSLGGQYRMQLCWSVDANYKNELIAYGQETERDCHDQYPRDVRTECFLKFYNAMEKRQLRREHLVLYISKKITTKEPSFSSNKHRRDYYDKLLGEYNREFHLYSVGLANTFGPSNVRFTPLDDKALFTQGLYHLNPAYADRKGHDPIPEFYPGDSLQELWKRGSLRGGHEHLPSYGFQYHGLYWNILTIRRLPDGTDPNTVLLLTQTDILDYSITVNLYPANKDAVVRREQEKLKRVRGDYASTKDPEFLEAMTMIEERIKAIKRGSVHPYDADFIIRIWATTPEELANKTQIIRTIINRLDGAKEHEPLTFSTNKQLWFQSWPGWVFGKYTHHAKYFEDTDLAAMLPFSSTFTGHLMGAEIIHPGPNRSLVGIKTNINGQPQHCVTLSMTGGGKTTLIETFLAQAYHRLSYLFLIEEGFGYAPFVKAVGFKTKVIRPDGNDTLNYFDTCGLPLTKEQKGEGAALCAFMAGVSQDEDKQRQRVALFARYIDMVYTDYYDEWAKFNPDQLVTVARETLATVHWQRALDDSGVSFLEAWIDAHQEGNNDRWFDSLNSLDNDQVIKFLKDPTTEELVRNSVFAQFKPKEMPTHSVLTETMRRTPRKDHDRRTVLDLAELLSDWTADEGSKGKLFDGESNISLKEKLQHIELSLLGNGESSLKTAAYYLITNGIQKEVMKRPRAEIKWGIIEEAAQVAAIPNGAALLDSMAARLRKYNCWGNFIFQNYAQLENEKVRKVVYGNTKMALVGRQRSTKHVEPIARELELPESAAHAVANYPMPEHINYAYSQFLYYHMDATRPVCGTVTITKNPPPREPILNGASNAQELLS